MPTPMLAHGVLGPFDEIIFVSVVVIFLAIMGISWIRSRHIEPDFAEENSPDPDVVTDPERFKLD